MKIDDSTWNKYQFVSVKDGKVIGYIGYNVSRADNIITHLSILNFTDDKMTLGIDLGNALTDIFKKFNFRGITFAVVIGNPIEKTYDKIIKKYGGQIVGVYKKYVKLIDGKYYDYKMYQIMKEDYYNKKEKNNG